MIDPRSNVKAGCDEPRIGITGVLDTEEEIWSPKYGLKGKIDVTVQAHVLEKPSDSVKQIPHPHIFPLEIKTGRQPSGIEHIAQTMLYTLLLSDRYSKLCTAFLFLLKKERGEIATSRFSPNFLGRVIQMPDYCSICTSRDDLIRVQVAKDEL